MKYTVVTTFNAAGYEKYGRRMIQTFLQTWPAGVDLQVYTEGCSVIESAPNLKVFDLETASAPLMAFKNRWQGVPKANGDVSADPVRSLRRDSGKGFKWDAVRFAHKVYAIFAAAQTTDQWLIWMDADMVCHSVITASKIAQLCPDTYDLCFLGRRGKYSECGLYAINLSTTGGKDFVKRFQDAYDHDRIFYYLEWHDSFVFDEIRKITCCKELDWSSHLITGEGHPLINSEWGAYLDHLKGDRKTLGRSKAKDLKVQRQEAYWQ